MATILAHIQVHPGMEGRFERTAASLYHATLATESAIRRYEYWRAEGPGSYYTLLSFDDFDSFLDHQTSPHHEAAGAELRETMQSIHLEWVDPIAEASPLPPTETSPLSPDAPDLRREYHRRFAAIIQDWWLPLRMSGEAPIEGGSR